MYKRLFEECFLLPWRGEWSITDSTHPLSFPLARSLNNYRGFGVLQYRHGYDVRRICAFVARDMDANHQGAVGDHVVDTQSGAASRSSGAQHKGDRKVGSAARMRSTQRTSTVISLISSVAYCFEQRIRHLRSTRAIFYFRIRGTRC